MTKIITKCESHICEGCGKEEPYVHTCLSCGVEHCFDCMKTYGVEYSHGIHFAGTGDGYFCLKCAAEPDPKVRDLWLAYRTVDAMKKELDSWWKDFDARGKKAEEQLMALIKKHELR